MGKSIAEGPHGEAIENMKDQLLIVFLKRIQAHGLSMDFTVAQVDDTGNDMLSFSLQDRVFHFSLSKKQ